MTRHPFLLLPLLWAVPAIVQASETGDIRGHVEDTDGVGVPGATITVQGANLAGELEASTDANGNFRILSISPGVHDLLVAKEGFAPMRFTITVTLDKATFVPIALQMRGATGEEIVVEEKLPVIDTTSSATTTNFTQEMIQNIPVGRSYQDVVNMVPGVYGRTDTSEGGPGDGNPSVRGEGQYGNNYLMDGISTRDPATKTFGADVNFDAIQEIQVYTDGMPAEFGQSTGMLVNVITKDGGDEHFGSVSAFVNFDLSPGQYEILDMEVGQEVLKDKRDFFNQELSLTAGGPIVKEKLWYFAAADLSNSDITFENMDPDAPYRSYGGSGFGKITWFVSPDLSFQYQFGYGRDQQKNAETSGLYATEAQVDLASRDLTHIVTGRWRPGDGSEVELKLSQMGSAIDSMPVSGSEELPSIFDRDSGLYTQNYSDFDFNVRSRLGGSLKYTQMVEHLLGQHKFKVGAELWRLTDERELRQTGPGGGVEYERYLSEGYACTPEANYTDCYGYTEYTDAGPLGHLGSVFGFFAQDDWQPVNPVTLNYGVRVDRETLYQNDHERLIDQWMPAPRLGLAWDITNDSKTLLAVNAGRYYDLNGNTFAEWGDTRSAYVYSKYRANPDTGGYDLLYTQDPVSNAMYYCTDASLASLKEGDPQTYDLIVRELCGGDANSLKPYHLDKLVVGLEREIIPLLALGLKGIASMTRGIPEDVDWDEYTWVITNPESKIRDYRALEITLEKQSDSVWQALASYTLSESLGTTPGQFEMASGSDWGGDGNGVGVYLDDVSDPETREAYFEAGHGDWLQGYHGLGYKGNDAGWYGYLPYHSFHQIKVAGSYTAPWGSTLGAVYEFDSGHAWQKRGLVDYYGYDAFPEGRGSRFMPPVHYFDLRVSHAFSFHRSRELEISVDAFNVLDLAQATTYYENDNDMFGLTMYRQEPRAIRAGMKFSY